MKPLLPVFVILLSLVLTSAYAPPPYLLLIPIAGILLLAWMDPSPSKDAR